MVQAIEKAGVPNMVWYNYRRAPAVTLAKQLIEGTPGRIFHYLSKVPAGLDYLKGFAAGRAACGGWMLCGWQRRYGRFACPLHRYSSLAEWRIDKVSAVTDTFIKDASIASRESAKGRHRRRLRVLARFGNGSLASSNRLVMPRGHKSALNTFEINGENARFLGPAEICTRLHI